MSAPTDHQPNWTVADLLQHFGPILFTRIRHDPVPGSATERDVIEIERQEGRLYELVNGVLVEKAMGYAESVLAGWLLTSLNVFLGKNNLGIAAGADGMLRLTSGLVRIPDVSFISWERLPGRRIPREPLPALAPDLAVEVLSANNTKEEMERKLREYFAAGVVLVWYIDPRKRTVRVYTSPDHSKLLRGKQILDGAPVLRGFAMPLPELFKERTG
jgi:Uma2 family endonuclease